MIVDEQPFVDFFHFAAPGWRHVGVSWFTLGAIFPHIRNHGRAQA